MEPRVRLAARHLIEIKPDHDIAPGRGIVLLQRLRDELAQDSETRFVRRTVSRRPLGIGDVDRAVHDHTSPIEQAFDLIDLECDPRTVLEGRELRPRTGAPMEPTLAEDVVHGLDVDAIMKRERHSPHVVAREHFLAFRAAQLSKDGRGWGTLALLFHRVTIRWKLGRLSWPSTDCVRAIDSWPSGGQH